ncbi:MAG: TonB-dependent receptor [Gammaproteobacteria bacterium]
MQLETIEVIERSDTLLGIGDSATQGTVGPRQIESRPLLRPGEVLETVPGVIITQHSGAGKANQFFLRGFNLDHGTDFATSIAGMPVNFPTHGHGQGYTDLNFLIPELVGLIGYRKGPYYADEGDFSAAGAAHIEYAEQLPSNIAEFTAGSYDYYRGLLAGSTALGPGHLLGGFETFDNQGPWDRPDDYRRYNGVLRYSQGDRPNGFNLTAMGYDGSWNATDQIPRRALESGLIDRFGALDDSDGGNTHRYSVSGEWRRSGADSATHAHAYFIDYALNLYSNFTFFLDDPVNGDQFEQADARQVYGFNAHHSWFGSWAGIDVETTAGVQLRYDDIGSVGLFQTRGRRRLATFRKDSVDQVSVSPYLQVRTQWLPKFRTIAGLRGDFYHFDVDSGNPVNSGTASDGLASPKLSLIFGPWFDTEYYVNLGYGFHSNDGRGTTITVDPKTGEPAERVEPLIRAKGFDVGLRTAIVPDLQSTLSCWLLDLDSELLFVGDAGTTEASRPSRRHGIEWTNYYTPWPWLILDADLSFSTARFKDSDPVGERIPGAIETVIAAGVTVDDIKGWFGSVRLRHFGARPLIEDDSVRSEPTTLVNAGIGYKLDKHWRVGVEILNLLDVEDSDIEYFYASRLPGEPAQGIEDIHFHPVEPLSVRATISAYY